MTVATVSVLHGINCPTKFLSQIEDATPQGGLAILTGIPSGVPTPLFTGVRGAKPAISFRTTQLASLLGLAGCYGADLSAGNTDLYYRQVTNMGTRVADASLLHTRIRLNKAFLHWKSITARHQAEASADCQLMAVYDGTNIPFVPAGTVALAGAPTAAEFFGLGPIEINSVTLPSNVEMTIDLGIELITAGAASEAYDSFVAVKQVKPVVTIRALGIENWANYGLIGTPLTSFVAYLRKVAIDGTGGFAYVPDATAAHIQFTGANGLITVEQTTGGGNNEATTALKIYLRSVTESAAPLTIATAVAVT